MRERFVQCMGRQDLYRIAYTEWGDPDNPKVVVCAHGLTRNGRDFDILARALSDEFRVVCPDIVGRGRSDWIESKSDYSFSTYVSDMVTLIARTGAEQVDWVGTSMGGIIGMMLAGYANTPIRRMVLNDVGPLITAEALRRIAKYIGKDISFPSLEAAEEYMRQIGSAFGPLTDEQWQHLTTHSMRETEKGLVFAYDPRLGDVFHQLPIVFDVGVWSDYEKVRCPVLAIRGAESDLLKRETWLEMAKRGPKAKLIEFQEIGHAPMLMADDQIAAIRAFLQAPPEEKPGDEASA